MGPPPRQFLPPGEGGEAQVRGHDHVERPGRTSPPFPGHDMVAGQRLREDWFAVLRTGARPT